MRFGGGRRSNWRLCFLLISVGVLMAVQMQGALIGRPSATFGVILISVLLNKAVLAVVLFPSLLVIGVLCLPETSRHELVNMQTAGRIGWWLVQRAGYASLIIVVGTLLGGLVVAEMHQQLIILAWLNAKQLIIIGLFALWFVPAYLIVQTMQLTRSSKASQLICLAAILVVNFIMLALPNVSLFVGFSGLILAQVPESGPALPLNFAAWCIICGLVWGWSEWHIKATDFTG